MRLQQKWGEGWVHSLFLRLFLRSGIGFPWVFDLAEVWHINIVRHRIEIICKVDSRFPKNLHRLMRFVAQKTRPGAPASALPRFKVERRRLGFVVLAMNACSAYNICMQYTIRNVPDYLDAALRVSAREQGKSLNEVAIEALARGSGLGQAQVRRRDLSDIAGSWRKDPAFERALAAQDTVDEEMWR
jgi:hypothetical protein